MMKQFLRKVFAGRRHTEEAFDSAESVVQAVDDIHIESKPQSSYELMLTKAEFEEEELCEESARMVEELVARIEARERGEWIRLRAGGYNLDSDRIHACIDRIERETYDATALLDWADTETARLYRTYVLPADHEEQETFVQSRMVMIYDTCEAIGMKPRPRARLFVEAIGWELHEDDFVSFESWLAEMSDAVPDEAAEEESMERSPDDVSHITPLQISREEVEREDIGKIDAFFAPLLEDTAALARRKESLVFAFYGFSGELEDMMNNAAVNAWASKLVEQHPYVFYVLNDEHVPMTQFVTSMVVTSRMENDQVVFDSEELDEFIRFIRAVLAQVAAQTGEDANMLVARFESRLFTQS
ncbi:hypothetical protein DFP93_11771 [Aneurinibacillus soli]|uniref:Uncharacterized protein n=1 Tax=Aneurinibacillus soli TaxID=1500254 RepID=A0A0U4NKD5_9BACL|nr:hypothetical protein [Aneurinibacillus soli]PYE59498.1 hypothetical protein DFP93_11771 [Aneurinibacillus soli]BAU29172.1 hypothetical protein CB4_03353 [Aneurinibacillus soli]